MMDSKTMEDVREMLLTRWRTLQKDPIRQIQSMAPQELDAPQAEIIDIAQALEESDREMSLAEQERKELIAVERALAKMATATFGVCEDCGEQIPVKRLYVLPEARLCAYCQTVQEKAESRLRVVGYGGR